MPKFSLHPLFERLPFLMADDHDGPIVEASEASDDGTIVTERTVPMKLTEIPEEITDVIEGTGPLGMSGKLRALPRSEFVVEGIFDLGQLHPQLADLFLGGRFPGGNSRELFYLFFDLANRFFELEVIAHLMSTRPNEIIRRKH